jgi:hypothetical protein
MFENLSKAEVLRVQTGVRALAAMALAPMLMKEWLDICE